MTITTVQGDLMQQEVDALVNPWNINVMPRWWPSGGVSGQLKKRTGPQPWADLRAVGRMPTGTAVVTGAGELETIRAIIHVAGLHPWWRASEGSVRDSVRAAGEAATSHGLLSVATPLIGAGTGGIPPDQAREWILDELTRRTDDIHWVIVLHQQPR